MIASSCGVPSLAHYSEVRVTERNAYICLKLIHLGRELLEAAVKFSAWVLKERRRLHFVRRDEK